MQARTASLCRVSGADKTAIGTKWSTR